MFKFKKKEKRNILMIDKELVKDHAIISLFNENNETKGVNIFYLEKYEFMWSLLNTNKTNIKNPSFPNNIFKDINRVQDGFDIIVIFSPKEDIDAGYFNIFMKDYNSTLYISSDYKPTLIRKYLDQIRADVFYTSAEELEEILTYNDSCQ